MATPTNPSGPNPPKPTERTERSAGVIVYHQPEGTPDRTYLLLDYGPYWDLPKGHLEKGEDDRAAAIRELREETGLTGVTLAEGFCHEIQYYFRGKRKHLVRKTVVFYLGRTPTDAVRVSHEHHGYRFEPFESAVALVKFASTKQVLRNAEAFLTKT